jgi:hypothetical protein
MNKLVYLVLLVSMVLSACGSNPSWEREEVSVISDRILADDVEAVWTLDQSQASEAGALIRIAVRKHDGTPIEEFDINHEKLLHLIVISKDLSYFNHVHPEYKGNGVFEIYNDFPAGGEYRFIADFKPTGGDAMTKLEWVRVDGEPAAPAPVVPDASLDKVFEGKRVKLTAQNLEARNWATLTFSFEDEKTGEPITDLEPYLGAIGHVVVLSEDGNRYVHVHADEDQGTGPEARFEAEFPKSGIYKIWGQFQRDQEVFTTAYVVNVP